MANKPSFTVIAYSGYFINDFKFTTKDYDNNRVTQNSGVNILATTLQVSSSKDKNPHTGVMEYYGSLLRFGSLNISWPKELFLSMIG